MKLADLSTGNYFLEGVRHIVDELAGEKSELAAILVEDNGVRRRALVATPLGIVDCFLDTEKPVVPRTTSSAIESRLIPWDEWPRLSVQGETYSPQRGDYRTTWTVEKWPEGVKIDHTAHRSQEITEFVRACIEHQTVNLPT